jgi:PAS domain S-box-containing protein
MWEKIVLNFLSNAFKFTFAGEISVELRRAGRDVELSVSDTGVGIPADELLHIFERFHRVRGTQARTHEGTGIGLALVQELVKLHGGTVAVTSAVGCGSTFTVTIPTGSAHLPSERLGAARTLTSTALGGEAYVEEALRWLPEIDDPSPSQGVVDALDTDSTWSLVHAPTPRHPPEAPSARILLADDNADMRAYVGRLLREHWEVEAVPDGASALAAVRARVPDLVLADVMMPGLDGFELLRELRADARTREVPVILLSARAGEESRVEGLDAGADDYLIKPFSARELIARVGAHLELARVRRAAAAALRESEARFRHMADHAPVMVWVTESDGSCSFLSQSWYAFTGQMPATGLGFGWLEAVHPKDRDTARDAFLAANAERQAFQVDYRLRRHDGVYRWAIDAAAPRVAADGTFLGYIGSVIDITERKRVEEELQASLREKEVLLKEVHHRVKNNLQLVASLLYLQSDQLRTPEDQAIFEDIQNRVKSMALIHESLYHTGDLEHFNLARYIGNLSTHLRQAYRAETSHIRLHTELEELAFDVDTAIPCGLILNELLTNALKYAFPDGRTGAIHIELRAEAGYVTLRVHDTGIGFPEDLDFRNTDSLGLQLVGMLTEQLGGTMTLVRERGTTFTVTFPSPRR